ncbi:MAG: hypothetical protein K2X94_03405 [Amoebophilaceae bacterium]|nr:hypothetical protein [Amoebophilaceae bacterium]
MVYTNTLLLIAIFLIVTLCLGIYRCSYVKTLKEYAIGNKNFSTANLVATVLATTFSGAALSYDLEGAHERGIHWVLLCFLLTTFSFKLLSVLVVRMGPFMSNISVAETIGQVYGPIPQVISGLASLARSASDLAIQLVVISKMATSCISGVSPNLVVIIVAIILVVYASLGGVRSVTLTDVFQLITFVTILPLIAWFMFQKIQQPTAIFSFLKNQESYQLSHLYTFDQKWVAMVLLLITWTLHFIDPAMVQRIYMARTVIQAKRVFNYAILGAMVINVVTMLIAIFVFVQTSNVGSSEAFNYMMQNLPSNEVKGLVCIALLAMSMSSSDSRLNANAVIFSKDIISALKLLPHVNPLLVARATSFMLGGIAILLAQYEQRLIGLLTLSFLCYIPVVTAPLLLAIFGFRATSRTTVAGMIVGIITAVTWNQLSTPENKIYGALLALTANFLTMMTLHYSLPQPAYTGWVKPDERFEQIKQEESRSSYRFKQKLAALFSSRGFAAIVPDSNKVIWVIIYLLIHTMASLFYNSWHHNSTWIQTNLVYWHFIQLSLIAFLLIFCIIGQKYQTLFSNHKALIGFCWFSILLFTLPINVVWHWKYTATPKFSWILSFTHLGGMILFLPLLMAIFCSIVIFSIGIANAALHGQLAYLMPMHDWYTIGLGSFLLTVIVHYKKEQEKNKVKIAQLEYEQKQKELEEERNYCYNRYLDTITTGIPGPGDLLSQALQKIGDLYEERMDKLSEPEKRRLLTYHTKHWKDYFDERTYACKYLLLNPNQTTLDELICGVEIIAEIRWGYKPKILLETPEIPLIANEPKALKLPQKVPKQLCCDIPYITELLVAAIGRITDHNDLDQPPPDQLIKISFYPTKIHYAHKDPKKILDDHQLYHTAVAIVVTNKVTESVYVPSVSRLYSDLTDDKQQEDQENLRPDLVKERMRTIVQAHYGKICFKFRSPLLLGSTIEATRSHKPSLKNHDHTHEIWPILIILPLNIEKLHQIIGDQLPNEVVATAYQIEEMRGVKKDFISFISSISSYEAVKLEVIEEVLDRLWKSYGGKIHCSGVLLFVRAIHIAQMVALQMKQDPTVFNNAVELIRHTATEIICSALLYDLPCYTHIPLTFIRANYNSNIFFLVKNILSIDQTKARSMQPSHFKEGNFISQQQACSIYIKLAERLYDLEQAVHYENKSALLAMARDTLAVDVYMADHYFKPTNIAIKLKSTAKEALAVAREALHIKTGRRPIA